MIAREVQTQDVSGDGSAVSDQRWALLDKEGEVVGEDDGSSLTIGLVEAT